VVPTLRGLLLARLRRLLATEGSEEVTLAAHTAADIAEKTSSELHVVLVGLSVGYIGMGLPEIADIPAPRQEELNKEAQRLLDSQVNQIEAAGGTVAQAHLRVGKSDEEIVSLADWRICQTAWGQPKGLHPEVRAFPHPLRKHTDTFFAPQPLPLVRRKEPTAGLAMMSTTHIVVTPRSIVLRSQRRSSSSSPQVGLSE
jgi:nucleotide-binding universal stress UspA family protein